MIVGKANCHISGHTRRVLAIGLKAPFRMGGRALVHTSGETILFLFLCSESSNGQRCCVPVKMFISCLSIKVKCNFHMRGVVQRPGLKPQDCERCHRNKALQRLPLKLLSTGHSPTAATVFHCLSVSLNLAELEVVRINSKQTHFLYFSAESTFPKNLLLLCY